MLFTAHMKLTLEQRLRAAAGPPAYMRRRRRIEDMEAAFLRELREVYGEALAQLHDAAAASQLLAHHARALDIATLNDLIDRHNRYYPMEANLRIDVRTRVVMDGDEPWRPMPFVTVEQLIARAVLSS
jgi:hypothetical protein